MGAFAAWLQATAPAQLIGDSVWLYPAVNVAHVLGVALLFGAIAVLDLRLLGLWRASSLDAVARPVRVAGFGLAAALLSGVALFAAQATDYVDNPFLYAKFAAIALALLNLALLHRSGALARGRETAGLRAAGGLSLLLWLAAVSLGRLIAYW